MDSLRNLKQLQLFYITATEEEDLLWVLTYLNACPLLEKLDLMVSDRILTAFYVFQSYKQQVELSIIVFLTASLCSSDVLLMRFLSRLSN